MTATPNPIDVLVGGNIQFWRLTRDLTVSDLAAALDLSVATIGSMEAGRTRIGAEELRQLCVLLRIRPAAIYQASDTTLMH